LAAGRRKGYGRGGPDRRATPTWRRPKGSFALPPASTRIRPGDVNRADNFGQNVPLARPLIFISHVHDDSLYAQILQEELDQALGGASFFNASDRA
jgi:hypothetical protein